MLCARNYNPWDEYSKIQVGYKELCIHMANDHGGLEEGVLHFEMYPFSKKNRGTYENQLTPPHYLQNFFHKILFLF